MSVIIPKENLTAYQRWELGGFDQKKAPATNGGASKGAAAAARLPTAEDVDRIHRDAHKQGYDAGYEEGTARARMEALRLHTLIEHLDGALSGFDQQVAEQLLQLSLAVARQVVRQAVAIKPTVVLDAVRDALLQLPHQHAGIYLNPEDASLARTYLGDQLAHAGHRIFEDPSIDRGGVRIEAGSSHVDATLETRWKRVIEGIGADSEWLEAPPATEQEQDT